MRVKCLLKTPVWNSKEEYTKYRESTSVLIPMVGYQYVPLFLKRSGWVRYCGSKVSSQKRVSFNFHIFCLLTTHNSSFLKIDTYLKRHRSISEKVYFPVDPAPSIPVCHLQDNLLRLSEVRIQSKSRRRSEERVRRELWERENPNSLEESPVEPVEVKDTLSRRLGQLTEHLFFRVFWQNWQARRACRDKALGERQRLHASTFPWRILVRKAHEQWRWVRLLFQNFQTSHLRWSMTSCMVK